MNVGREKPVKPSPRCMDRLRNDLKEYQVDPKNRTENGRMEKSNHNDRIRTGIRSAKVNMFNKI